MLKIEKDIPIPEGPPGRGGKKKIYPFSDMEVGDSFFVECDGEARGKKQTSIMASCRGEKVPGKKFTTRSVEGGLRCWRIE